MIFFFNVMGGGGSFTIPGQRPVMLNISTSDTGTNKFVVVGVVGVEIRTKKKKKKEEVITGIAKENIH